MSENTNSIEGQETYDLNLLDHSLRKWDNSPGLRFVYESIYRRVASAMPNGPILELGSGIGKARYFIPNLITSDIRKTPYVDRAEDCYSISLYPDKGGWAGLFALDVLHHLRFPMRFFERAGKVLRPGGKLILEEPAATAGGRLFYKLFHPEPMVVAAIQPPFIFEESGESEDFANMGMGVGLFIRHREMIEGPLESFGLSLIQVSFSDFLAYPLTGGYSKPQMFPTSGLKALLALEGALPQWVHRTVGLRMQIVIEKKRRE